MGRNKIYAYGFYRTRCSDAINILNSTTAIEVNVQIIRVFSKMRELLLTNKDILLKLEQVEKKMMQQDGKMKQYEKDTQLIFDALKKLLSPTQEPRQRIGFKP